MMYGLAGRYATGLYLAAAKKGSLLNVESDFSALSQSMEDSPALRSFVSDPSHARPLKSKAMVEILASIGACETTKNAFATMADNGRLGETMKVMSMFSEMMAAAKGEVSVVITSAENLTEDSLKQIKEQITSDYLEPGEKTKVSVKVNPKLLKGYTVEIGDKFVDCSVVTQLKKLQKLLLGDDDLNSFDAYGGGRQVDVLTVPPDPSRMTGKTWEELVRKHGPPGGMADMQLFGAQG